LSAVFVWQQERHLICKKSCLSEVLLSGLTLPGVSLESHLEHSNAVY